MRALDLFSGIGGFSLGLERAGMRTTGFCEIDPFCRAVLRKHWPDVPIHDDIRTLTAEQMGPIDLVSGGVPCQPASCAGKMKGGADERWLWPDFLRVVREAKPMWVLAENVPGLIGLQPQGLRWVVGELEDAGYESLPLLCGACHVGAPHRRLRIWIVAYRPRGGLGTVGCSSGSAGHADQRGEGMADAEPDGRGSWRGIAGNEKSEGERRGKPPGDVQPGCMWPAGPRQPQHDWEARRLLELPVGGTIDGVPVRLVRVVNRNALRAYGNAVVPKIVELIGRSIMAESRQGQHGGPP